MRIYTFISAVFFSYVCMHALLLFHSCHGLRLPGNETDRLALLEIKARITVDPFGVFDSWNETNHFCNWHGVFCGHRHQRVTMLDLQSLNLAGSIAPHVGNLSFLRVIYLQNNSFSHQIPTEIGHLRRLQGLHLENNSLSGEIPSNLSACSQLIIVSLGFNFLVGTIPEELGTLPKLRTIAIYRNNLSGSLPRSFSNLSSLEVLSASTNNLNGSIPDIFGQLTNLTTLILDLNSFSGMLPPSVFNLSSLIFFSVVVNRVHGSLPSNLGVVFPRLEYFDIARNQFHGPIPVSLSNASNLAHFGISGNQLHGEVPSLENLHRLERLILGINHLGSGKIGDLSFICDLVNATRLEYLEINSNYFGGMLPPCTANLSSSLVSLFVSWNKIFGRMPNGIGNLHNLEKLRLSFNQFSGHIPPDLGKLNNLYELDLAENLLSGNVPSSFGNLSGLNRLYLSYNNLQGNIPSSLGQCLNLILLSLAYNNLSGIIPGGMIGPSYSYVEWDLGDNNFSGFLPEEVGNLINLGTLDVSGNMLSGEIPTRLSGCIALEYLYLQRNFFQGTIPASLGSLRGIKYLYLSHNNLSGAIPEFLEGLEVLQYLNLSYNHLEGIVPAKGIFMNATATSVKGNSGLCGGIPAFQLPKCRFRHTKRPRLSLTLRLTISLVCGLLGVTFTLLFLYFCCMQRERTRQSISSNSENFLKVSYHSLVKATDGFSSANLIGMGSFGSVYKGVLEQGDTTIAIKVLNLVHPGASKSFTAECEALKNIRHRNLVKVLSACSGTDYRGCDFKALIYEFMVNGSLEEWLHPQEINGVKDERQRILKFSQRLNIAIDIAMALEYLHYHCETPIVHCDLKPSNVLLDDDMVGHVGDFGLVKFLHRASDTVSGDQSSSLGVRGTIGYTPPEYGMGHEVWTQGDVYSYGILLLQMFTGSRPTDDLFQGTSNIHNFVKAALPAQVLEIVDPVLVQEKMEGEMRRNNNLNDDSTRVSNKVQECLATILEIGVACSTELPTARLDISDVVAEMCRIRNKYMLKDVDIMCASTN